MANKVLKKIKELLGPNLTKQIRPIGHGLKAIFSNFWFGGPTHKFSLNKVLYEFFLPTHQFFSPEIKLIGINGTKGKTSTVIFTAQLLNKTGIKTGYISTALIFDGEEEFPNPYKMGTIDSWKMNQLLDKMRYNRCDVVVLEMTSQGLEQNRHWGLKAFDSAVFLNAYPEHIEAHGSWENYLKAKSKLFKSTVSGAEIFINGETTQLNNFNQIKSHIPENKQNSWKVNKIIPGSDFQIQETKDIFLNLVINEDVFPTKLVAKFEVTDLFFAWKVASLYSKEIQKKDVMLKIFAEMGNLPGRMEWVVKLGVDVFHKKSNTDLPEIKVSNEYRNLSIVVDYAHEPESLKQVLYTFAHWRALERFDYVIHVLSCDGVGRDDWKKPIMGDLSYKKADFTVLTTDNYSEDDNPEEIVKLLCKNYNIELYGYKFAANINRFEAFKIAIQQAKKQMALGKKVVICSTGVGTENGLTSPDGILPWDEREKWIETYNNTKLV